MDKHEELIIAALFNLAVGMILGGFVSIWLNTPNTELFGSFTLIIAGALAFCVIVLYLKMKKYKERA